MMKKGELLLCWDQRKKAEKSETERRWTGKSNHELAKKLFYTRNCGELDKKNGTSTKGTETSEGGGKCAGKSFVQVKKKKQRVNNR